MVKGLGYRWPQCQCELEAQVEECEVQVDAEWAYQIHAQGFHTEAQARWREAERTLLYQQVLECNHHGRSNPASWKPPNEGHCGSLRCFQLSQ